jgi:hypothetical protein
MVIASPPFESRNPDIASYYRHWRACVGKTAKVIYVDENGRPELNIDEYVIGERRIVPDLAMLDADHPTFHWAPLIGCSISLAPECVALVERSTLSPIEQARLIEDR